MVASLPAHLQGLEPDGGRLLLRSSSAPTSAWPTPETCTLEGGVVGDEAAGTVTINLDAPDPEFFDKLAVPHAVILPADSPTEDVGTEPIAGHRRLHDHGL